MWDFSFLAPAVRSLRQGDQEFLANLGYVARPCLKNTKHGQRDDSGNEIFATRAWWPHMKKSPHDEAGYTSTQAVTPSPCLWEAETALPGSSEASQPRVRASEGKKRETLSEVEEGQAWKLSSHLRTSHCGMCTCSQAHTRHTHAHAHTCTCTHFFLIKNTQRTSGYSFTGNVSSYLLLDKVTNYLDIFWWNYKINFKNKGIKIFVEGFFFLFNQKGTFHVHEFPVTQQPSSGVPPMGQLRLAAGTTLTDLLVFLAPWSVEVTADHN